MGYINPIKISEKKYVIHFEYFEDAKAAQYKREYENDRLKNAEDDETTRKCKTIDDGDVQVIVLPDLITLTIPGERYKL